MAIPAATPAIVPPIPFGAFQKPPLVLAVCLTLSLFILFTFCLVALDYFFVSCLFSFLA
jgi:hypothetical protein